MTVLLQDVRYALRHFAKSPGFTLAAVLSFAIGIGVNTAVFSSMDAVVLRPLAVPRLDRVITLTEQHGGSYQPVAMADYEDWLRDSRSFEALAIRKDTGMTLTGAGNAEPIQASLTSPDFFAVLRAKPWLGRVYNQDESHPGRDSVALLSYGFWQSRFAADPAVLGRNLQLDQRTYTIIGIMPKSMQYPSTADVYLPLAPQPKELANRGAHDYLVVGRLREGVTLERAQAEMRTLAEHLAAQYPATNQGWSVHAELLLDGINGPYTPGYYRMMLGATLFVLMIVCANVANLQLARCLTRRSEIAMRTALGASRGRVLQQLLTENILLGMAGAAGGLAFANLYLHLTLITMPDRVVRYLAGWSNISLNGRAMAFSLLLAGLAGVLAGIAPAIEALRVNPIDQLKTGSRGATGSGQTHRLRNIFAIAQISLAVALVIGAALMAKGLDSWFHMADVYRPRQTLTFTVTLPGNRYATPQQRADWYAASLGRLRAVPGVTHVELTSALPYDEDAWVRDVEIEGRPVIPGKFQSALQLPVSPGYFAALRIPILGGRVFDARDALTSIPVAIVSQRFAAQYFPGGSPLGHRIRMGGRLGHEPWLTIVGVARETNYSLWDPTPHPAVYQDTAQAAPVSSQYILTTDGNPLALVSSVHAALAAIDPLLPLSRVETYAQLVNDNLTGLMYAAAMLGFDAVFAMFLASIGIFATMNHSVSERMREIGIRLALGAPRQDVLGMVLARAGKVTLIGLVSGLLLAFGMARGLRSLLQGVTPNDPLVFASVAGAIALVAVVASWLPAKRAMQIEPMAALRDE